jgi:hypothetical protein
MFERTGGWACYRRSRALLSGSWVPAILVLAPIVLTSELLVAAARHFIDTPWHLQAVRHLIEAATLPFEAAAAVLLYLQVRAARETRWAHDLAREIDQSLDPRAVDVNASLSPT